MAAITYYPIATAQNIVAAFQENEEDGWAYYVQQKPEDETMATIAIYDDENNFVGYWSK